MKGVAALFRNDWSGLLVVFLAGAIALAILRPGFLSSFNLYVLLLAFSLNAVVALGQMIILAIGQMNLALGAIGGLCAIVFAGTMQVWGLPWPLAALLALVVSSACGLLNGLLIIGSGINAFIVTLATLYIFKGINLGLTEAQPFYGIAEAVKAFGNAALGPLPWLLVVPLLAAAGIAFLLARTVAGRQMLAVGGNTNAAVLSGISVPRTVILAHVISGLLAGIAGMLATARLQSGQPSIGDDWLIMSFAAPILGGAILTGGHVSVAGTCMGVLVVALITNALVLLAVDPFLVQLLLGLLILAAVVLNRWREVGAEAHGLGK
ncbi:MAG: ABC transporter permease [Geminicoccaceae bacterium]